MCTEISNAATVVYRDTSGQIVTVSHSIKTRVVDADHIDNADDADDAKSKRYRENVETSHR